MRCRSSATLRGNIDSFAYGTFKRIGCLPPSPDRPHHLGEVLDDPGAGPLDLGPHPEVVGAVADDEVPGIREQVQVVPDLSESVGADLPCDAAVGDGQTQRIAEPLEELR